MLKINCNKNILPSDLPCISHNDRGFTLGHGLFETILINHNTIPALDYHWRRLESSALLTGIMLPFNAQDLNGMLKELIKINSLDDKLAGARVTITHGQADRGIMPAIAPKPNFLISVFEHVLSDKPFSALIVKTKKNEHSLSSQIKSLSYLDNIFAKQEAMDKKYDEAILLNTANNIADGAISNIYIVKNKQIFTPAISDGALPGVVRSILIEELRNFFSIKEKTISLEEILYADEVFLTNALMGVKHVNKLNNIKLCNFNISFAIRDALKQKKGYI